MVESALGRYPVATRKSPTSKPSRKSTPASVDKNRKQAERRTLQPLLEELKRRTHVYSYTDLAARAGLEEYIPSRLMGAQSVSSPSYVTLTRLIVTAGMTPNQAAEMVGLFTPTRHPGKAVLLEEDDPRLVEVVRAVANPDVPPEVKESVLKMIGALTAILRGDYPA